MEGKGFALDIPAGYGSQKSGDRRQKAPGHPRSASPAMGQMGVDSLDRTRHSSPPAARNYFIGEMRIFVSHGFTVDRRAPNAPETFPAT